ncbi:MAG: NAD(P)H-dependent glycerol-3-phosphate dehydrogenase [Bdellovibrionota bacterium]
MMENSITKIAVIGGGSWGTALAQSQAKMGHSVWLWLRNSDLCESINQSQLNSKYHPGVPLSPRIQANTDVEACYQDASVIFLALPSSEIVEWIEETKIYLRLDQSIVCTAKGLDLLHLQTLSQKLGRIYGDRWLHQHFATISGPSFASELIRDLPTAVDIGCTNPEVRNKLISLCTNPHFQWSPTEDLVGVEMGGALKNILAIASGACEGFGLGENARAALMTKGLEEISRLGQALGAKPQTFFGLSGMGDLILTCTGEQSRNRRVGLLLAQGLSIKEILSTIGQTAEGIRCAKIAYDISIRHNIQSPIIEQTYHALYGQKDVKQAIGDLIHAIHLQ